MFTFENFDPKASLYSLLETTIQGDREGATFFDYEIDLLPDGREILVLWASRRKLPSSLHDNYTCTHIKNDWYACIDILRRFGTTAISAHLREILLTNKILDTETIHSGYDENKLVDCLYAYEVSASAVKGRSLFWLARTIAQRKGVVISINCMLKHLS